MNTRSNLRPKILMVVPQTLPNFFDDVLEKGFNCDIILAPDIEEKIYAKVAGVHAIIGCPRAMFSERLLNQAGPSLRWMHNPGAGSEAFFIPSFVNSRIVFTNGRIIQGPECADHALALLLSLTRNISRFARGDDRSSMPRPIELRGKKGLVFGGGGIGVNVAERLVAFGVEVSIVDNELINMFSFVKNQYFVDQISEAVGSADAVICCAPLTTKTHKIFDKHLIARFKKGSYFINVSRGKLADAEALLFGLDSNILAGVGLDVTDPEPLPKKHELMNYKNVIISGHTAGLSEHNRERSRKLIIKNIERFLAGETLLNTVNKQTEY